MNENANIQLPKNNNINIDIIDIIDINILNKKENNNNQLILNSSIKKKIIY